MAEKFYQISESLLGEIRRRLAPIIQNLVQETQGSQVLWNHLNQLKEVPEETAQKAPEKK